MYSEAPETRRFRGYFFLINSEKTCREFPRARPHNKGEIGANSKKWVKKWVNNGSNELAYSTDLIPILTRKPHYRKYIFKQEGVLYCEVDYGCNV